MSLIEKLFAVPVFRFLKELKTSSADSPDYRASAEASLKWFLRSVGKSGAPSSAYSMIYDKFLPPCVEVSGHWLHTILLLKNNCPDLYSKILQPHFNESRIAEWIISRQRNDGTWPAGYSDYQNQSPGIFSSGIALNALLDYYVHTTDAEVMKVIKKNLNWLVKMQSGTGSWDFYTYHDLPACSYAGYVMLRAGKILSDESLVIAGKKHFDFIFSQRNNGKFYNEFLFRHQELQVSSFAWMIKAIFESGKLLNDADFIHAAEESMSVISSAIHHSGFIPGQLDDKPVAIANYCSLYGNAVISILAKELQNNSGRVFEREIASRSVSFAANRQIKSKDSRIDGGITGSWPVSGKYKPYEIPGEAVAMFVKAVLLQIISMPEKYDNP